jgi:hypothetical protein
MRRNPGGSLKLTYTSLASFNHELSTPYFTNIKFNTQRLFNGTRLKYLKRLLTHVIIANCNRLPTSTLPLSLKTTQ